MEPEQFKRGKRFHRRVQVDWEGFIENAMVSPEHYVKLDSPLITKSGRIDIFVNKIEDFVSVFELKSTDCETWREKGIITYSKLGGKIYYKLSDVLLLLKQNEVPCVTQHLKIAL
jgi:hypothetical protein